MLETIEDLFNLILNTVKQLRINNPNYDGLKFWHLFKSILNNSKFISKWKSNIPQSYIKNIMSLPEYTINGYNQTNIIENNHFIIQTVRIPMQEEPSLRKIIQIGLNIGQYLGSSDNKKLLKYTQLSDYIYKSDCKKKLSTILSENDINKLKLSLPMF